LTLSPKSRTFTRLVERTECDSVANVDGRWTSSKVLSTLSTVDKFESDFVAILILTQLQTTHCYAYLTLRTFIGSTDGHAS